MNGALQETLGGLAALPGVRAVVAASEQDGLPIASICAVDVDADALAAFATALFRRTRLANGAAGYGSTRHLVLDAERGRLFVALEGDLAIVLLSEPDTAVGLLRVALQRALRSVV